MTKKQQKTFRIIEPIDIYTLRNLIDFCNGCASEKKEIILCTSGGSAEVASAIYDYITVNKIQFKIVCIGNVESAGIIILMAGTKKIAYPNTVFMTHGPSVVRGNAESDSNFKKREKKQSAKLVLYKDFIRTILPKDFPYCTDEYYFDANEALKHGIIDEIIK